MKLTGKFYMYRNVSGTGGNYVLDNSATNHGVFTKGFSPDWNGPSDLFLDPGQGFGFKPSLFEQKMHLFIKISADVINREVYLEHHYELSYIDVIDPNQNIASQIQTSVWLYKSVAVNFSQTYSFILGPETKKFSIEPVLVAGTTFDIEIFGEYL